MTKYTLEDGSDIYINDIQICTKVDNGETITLTLSNGESYTIKK